MILVPVCCCWFFFVYSRYEISCKNCIKTRLSDTFLSCKSIGSLHLNISLKTYSKRKNPESYKEALRKEFIMPS